MKKSALIGKYKKEIERIQKRIHGLQLAMQDKKVQAVLTDRNPAKIKAIAFKLTVSHMILNDALHLLLDKRNPAEFQADRTFIPSGKQALLPI